MIQTRRKYINLYKEYHAMHEKGYPGNSFRRNGWEPVTELIFETSPTTLLDYGCGKGKQYHDEKLHEPWGIMPTLYDPGFPEHENLPEGPFDGIYSTDVMEHIPEQVIPSVFEWIFSNATKFVYLGICTRLALARLPNGENAHCTVKSHEWWADKIREHNKNNIYTHLRCYGDSDGYEIFRDGESTLKYREEHEKKFIPDYASKI